MPKYTKPRKTWQYTTEFKVKAVQLSLIDGVQVKDVADTLDIHPFMLSRWRKEYREGKIVADKRKKMMDMTSAQQKEISKVKQLEAENKRLKQEVDLLKKWQRFLAQKHQRDIGVKQLCQWCKVSRSGYYDWLKRSPSEREIEDRNLKQRIQTIYDESEGRYGSPRIWQVPKKQGFSISRKRIARLMKDMCLIARMTQVTHRSPGLRRFLASGDNLRSEGDVPQEKNKVWVADVTYLKVAKQWHYLSVAMDLHSRRIIGWSIDTKRTTGLTKRTLSTALRKRKPEKGLMLHTDRGVEYRGSEYQKDLNRHGILHSLSRPGKCTDNAHMESFFHTLKAELIRGSSFQTKGELKYALARYINDFYNRKRLHSGIGYCSPMEYERIAA